LNESDARTVLLVRAVETADPDGKFLSREDKRHADRAAAELARWRAAERREPPASEDFLARRAELLQGKLAERFPKALSAFHQFRWRPWVGVLLPAAALLLGLFAEHLSDRHRINILAFPLLGILAWNLTVYGLLLVHALRGLGGRDSRHPGWLTRQLAGFRLGLRPRSAGALRSTLTGFALDWTRFASPLLMARASRVLHLSAALFAAGALAGLYVRGLVFEYRAGWESTFLDARGVHAILGLVLGPAASLLHMPFPGVDEVARLNWNEGNGENAARWIHWYALVTALGVILPRLALALFARLAEHRLSSRFPLELDESYFRRTLAAWRQEPARVAVYAYGHTPSEAAGKSLAHIAASLFGENVELRRPAPIRLGDEDAFSAESDAADLVVALFNLTATPETEHHGVFLDRLGPAARGSLLAVVDESAYRRRLGGQGETRIRERREAWEAFLGTRRLPVVFGELESEDLEAMERELQLQSSRLSGAQAGAA
jgi:hypothetical protein